MRILFLSDIVPFPPDTGIKIRTYNIIRQLHENGNQVFLMAFNHRIFLENQEKKLAARTGLEKLCAEVHILEIPWENHPALHYMPLLINLFDYKPYRVRRYMSGESRRLFHRLVQEKNIDLIHLDKTEFYEYTRRYPGIPAVATNHNVESDLMRQRSRFEISLPRKVFAYCQFLKTRRYEKYALERVSGYITCTDVDQVFFEDLGVRNRHVTIENGVDCAYYHPMRTEEENYILIIGAQNRESTANFDATTYFLQDIWPRLSQRNASLKLKIAGRHPDSSIIEAARKDKGIEVVGYVEDDREILASAKALIVPLRIGGGSRLKILTAMGMGKTVISTSKGAEGIKCRHGENILISDEAEELARLIAMAVEDSALRRAIGERARYLAENVYDWKVIGKKLSSFYEEIIRLPEPKTEFLQSAAGK